MHDRCEVCRKHACFCAACPLYTNSTVGEKRLPLHETEYCTGDIGRSSSRDFRVRITYVYRFHSNNERRVACSVTKETSLRHAFGTPSICPRQHINAAGVSRATNSWLKYTIAPIITQGKCSQCFPSACMQAVYRPESRGSFVELRFRAAHSR